MYLTISSLNLDMNRRRSAYILLGVIILTTQYPVHCEPVGFCYYQPLAELAPEDIDPEICTHIIVFSVRLDNNDKIVASDEVTKAIEKVVKLKAKNPELKVSVSLHDKVDAWSAYQDKANVAENVVKFAKQNNLDGFDIYLMYMKLVYEEENTCTRVNSLLEELTKSFNKTNLFVSVCIPYKHIYHCKMWTFIRAGFDFVILRAYGFSGGWDTIVKHASPLKLNTKSKYNTMSAAGDIQHFGISQEKIIIGFPAYSWPQNLKSKSSNDVGSPAVNGANMGFKDMFAHVVNSSVSYFDLCSKYRNASYKWDNTSEASYLHTDTDWLSFESRRSLCYKTTWLVSNNYTGGYMLWTLDMDDHKNACGFGRFPLAKYLKDNIDVSVDFTRCNKEPYLAFMNMTKDKQMSVEKMFDKLKNMTGGEHMSVGEMTRAIDVIEEVGKLAMKNKTIAKQMLSVVGDVMNMNTDESSASERRIRTERVGDVMNIVTEESSATERGIRTDRVLFLLEKLALKMEVRDGVKSVISTDSLSIGAFMITNETESFIVSMKFEVDDSNGQSNDVNDIEGPSVAVSSEFLRKLVKENIPRIHVIAYRNAKLFINTTSHRNPGNHSVVSIVVSKQIQFNPNEIVLKYTIPIVGSDDKFDCVFWDKTKRTWSTNGVSSDVNTDGNKYCRSTHLSAFCIMTQVNHTFAEFNKALDIISTVGCSISIVGLWLTIVTYAMFKSLHHVQSGKILLNLCASMFLMNVTFLILGSVPIDRSDIGNCMAISMSLHYFLLTTFGWMMVEALHMYEQLILVFTKRRRFFMTSRMLAAWCIPLIIVSTTALAMLDDYKSPSETMKHVSNHGSGSGSDQHSIHASNQQFEHASALFQSNNRSALFQSKNGSALFQSRNGSRNGSDEETRTHGGHNTCVISQLNAAAFYAAVFAPTCLMVLANTIVFVRVTMLVLRRSSVGGIVSNTSISVTQLRGAMSVMFVLGITWVFGPLASIETLKIPLSYMFTICNSLQGGLVFLFRCLLNTEARLSWKYFIETGKLKKRRGTMSDTAF